MEEEAKRPTELSTACVKSIRASSVLNGNKKEYGAKNALDPEEDTCWNSDQGLPQSLTVRFTKPVSLQGIEIQFQGGFVATACTLFSVEKDDRKPLLDFHPKDKNEGQFFAVLKEEVSKIAIEFKESSDFYGRVTIYRLRLFGEEL